jgi:hypothetical protein
MPKSKSAITVAQTEHVAPLGRSYYCYCLESALSAIGQARALVKGDVVDENHQLAKIQGLIGDALDAS